VRILILGGTVFLGRHITAAALARGHEVTLFNRGQSAPDLFPAAEQIHGDRDGGLAPLAGRRWDVVVDTIGYVSGIVRIVRASAEMLAASVGSYVFISSESVYADMSLPGVDETAPVAVLPEGASTEEMSGESYGPLKALCERAVETALPSRALIIRPGLIVGPYDPTDRFTYWPHRLAAGGEALAPEPRDKPIQFIDVRDLAEWIVRMIERGAVGVYNANGRAGALTMAALLDACVRVAGADTALTWVAESFLLEHDVGAWMDLPLWIPTTETTMAGFLESSVARALAAGLTYRPLDETIRDTLAWDATRPQDAPRKAGLTREREAALLAAWHNRE
jgi:2'-hydroxyisoflavone reductase